jgi:hypothetical protein
MPIQRKPGLPSPLQKKAEPPNQRKAPPSPAPYRPQPLPKVLQRKTHCAAVQPKPIGPNMRTARSAPAVKATVVQATKYFPNLHPGAVEPVNPSSVYRLDSIADQYRLHRQHSHSVNVPNQQYNFVRTRDGQMLLHNRYRHPSIAEGKQVLYAGEVFFNNGKLEWWSNGSGHYQPGADDAEQARLPMDRFFSYQQIIKGEHTRKKDKG